MYLYGMSNSANKPPQFSTKPEALHYLKNGIYAAVSWRVKSGANRGRIATAEMIEGKIKIK